MIAFHNVKGFSLDTPSDLNGFTWCYVGNSTVSWIFHLGHLSPACSSSPYEMSLSVKCLCVKQLIWYLCDRKLSTVVWLL